MTKETWIKFGTNTLIVALVACIPLGLFLAFWFNNSNWLALCATLFLFLS